MSNNDLINEITDFCIKNKLFNKTVHISNIRSNIKAQLKDCAFIENLYNTIYLKTKYRKNIDIDRIINLLLELEKVRLEIEYKGVK